MADESPAHTVTLRSPELAVEIVSAGASVRSVRMPDVEHSLVLGAADLAFYGPSNRAFLGASVGRHANRIAGARFSLDGREHRLRANEPPHHLHGGPTGLWSRTWAIREVRERKAVFAIRSPDGEEGYPGNAEVEAVFSIEDAGILSILYRGTVDRPSVLNLTPHLYFNLSGEPATRDHRMRLAADSYLPIDAARIPTGEVRSVEANRYDFRAGRTLREGPEAGLDHCFCLSPSRHDEPRPALDLVSETAGIAMTLSTTEPGVQIYDGAGFDGSIAGLDGAGIARYGGVAIEPQGWPNGPNEAGFPSPVLRHGNVLVQHSRYRFHRF